MECPEIRQGMKGRFMNIRLSIPIHPFSLFPKIRIVTIE